MSQTIELEAQSVTVGEGAKPLHVKLQEAPQEASVPDERLPLGRSTLLKLLSAGFSFYFAGCNDGSLGTLIPYLLKAYDINTSFVAIIYGVTFLGWFTAALTNSYLVHALHLSTGTILILGAFLQLLANALRVWAPPFALFCFSFFFTYLGMGYQDAHSNTFTATVKGAHRWLGFIHAMYAFGTMTGPFVAAAIAHSSRWNWFYFYTIGIGCINLGLVIAAFGDKIVKRDPGETATAGTDMRRNKRAMREFKDVLKLPSVWLVSLFFFFFLGAAITASGWVVQYLVKVRHGKLASMGYVPTGFSGGTLLGRLVLVEPSHRFGERRMIAVYVVLCIALQLVFWLVPNTTADIVVLALTGFFSGPFFPTGISVGSKLFPKHLQSSALSFLFVLAQAGGSIFPSITGVIAAHRGVEVLQPILVALLTATLISWLLVPSVKKPQD